MVPQQEIVELQSMHIHLQIFLAEEYERVEHGFDRTFDHGTF